jgi:2-polyprenyl-6-methoxyphenol hydroxylase-like FAD-dependent oxidoreductase
MTEEHANATTHDVLIVGGGVAGSSLAIVLSRGGLDVVVIEREARFRDRVRGEGIHPWGYREARQLGLEPVLEEAGANPLFFWQPYFEREPVEPTRWDDDDANPLPELGVSHPRLQEATIKAAKQAGATIFRPASARSIAQDTDGAWGVHLALESGEQRELKGKLLVGADGRTSAVRGWLGIHATHDPEHHRFGGALVEGADLVSNAVHVIYFPGGTSYIMPQGEGRARVYFGGAKELIEPLASDHSGEAFLSFLRERFPAGALDQATLAGPLAFFPNADIVRDRLTGPNAVLIGDAAGANDPSVGQGLSLAYRDVHELSDLLLKGDSWQDAIDEFDRRRSAYHAIAREHATWIGEIAIENGDDADAKRAGMRRAKEADPTQAGFAFMYSRGPFELDVSPEGRARFFGEDAG